MEAVGAGSGEGTRDGILAASGKNGKHILPVPIGK